MVFLAPGVSPRGAAAIQDLLDRPARFEKAFRWFLLPVSLPLAERGKPRVVWIWTIPHSRSTAPPFLFFCLLAVS